MRTGHILNVKHCTYFFQISYAKVFITLIWDSFSPIKQMCDCSRSDSVH